MAWHRVVQVRTVVAVLWLVATAAWEQLTRVRNPFIDTSGSPGGSVQLCLKAITGMG